MNSYELAQLLDGYENNYEIMTERLEKQVKEASLVVVFGYSDDLMELRGAIDDEFGCFNGGTAYITKKGLLAEPDCGEEGCPYYEAARKAATPIEAVWGNTGNPCWSYKTEIPHETFRIYEDAELFCVGIVFSVNDLPV